MAVTVIYTPENRELDLSALSPADYDLIKGLRGLIHRGAGILLCKRASGDREMSVFRSPGGRYFARHFSGGGHGDHAIRRMTDEHLRSVECWVGAWDPVGYTPATEVSTDNKARLDAVAFGPRTTGLEVQFSDEKPSRIKARHTQRLHAKALTGKHARILERPLEVVWFAPVGHPEWLYQVPSISCTSRSWEVAPDPRKVIAIGVQAIDIKTCEPKWFPQCPVRKFSWCGGLGNVDRAGR